jgi:hypothetical protein
MGAPLIAEADQRGVTRSTGSCGVWMMTVCTASSVLEIRQCQRTGGEQGKDLDHLNGDIADVKPGRRELASRDDDHRPAIQPRPKCGHLDDEAGHPVPRLGR